MEVNLDIRLLSLGAALTASSQAPASPEHRLVTGTRDRLRPLSDHPSVRWFHATADRFGLLGLAMQAVQLGDPPDFPPASADEVPRFVRKYFSDVSAESLSHHLSAFWREADLDELHRVQRPQWTEAEEDLSSVLSGADLDGFQELFFGRFPYALVAILLANVALGRLRGVGVANRQTTYAVCLPRGDEPFRADPAGLLVLAQHEASHPVLDDIQQLHPQVPAACAFIERAYPPAGSFASNYGDPEFRWVETVIRASSYFYLASVGRGEDARAYLLDRTPGQEPSRRDLAVAEPLIPHQAP